MLRFIYKHNIKLTYIDRALVKFNGFGRSSKFGGEKIKPHPEILRVWRVHYKYRWLWFLFTFPLYNMVLVPIWIRIKRLKGAVQTG